MRRLAAETLVILGAPNDVDGRLSSMAVARADTAVAASRKSSSSRLIITGGWGSHFNISPKPHVHWVARYLFSKGVDEGQIVGGVLSGNTVEDAIGVKLLLSESLHDGFTVITSSFHSARAEFVFRCLFPQRDFVIMGVRDCETGSELNQRAAHEQRALSILRKRGGVVVSGKTLPYLAGGITL